MRGVARRAPREEVSRGHAGIDEASFIPGVTREGARSRRSLLPKPNSEQQSTTVHVGQSIPNALLSADTVGAPSTAPAASR